MTKNSDSSDLSDSVYIPYYRDPSQPLGTDYGKIEKKWEEWSGYLEEKTWELKDAIRRISDPTEWACSLAPAKYVLADISSQENSIYERVVDAIKKREIQAIYNHERQDYLILPADLLAYLKSQDFCFLPAPCVHYFGKLSEKVHIDLVLLKAKHDNPLKAVRGLERQKEGRSDRKQMKNFVEVAKQSIAAKAPDGYDDLFDREEVKEAILSFTYSNGKPKEIDVMYLRRKISKFMPSEARQAGARPRAHKKSCKVVKMNFTNFSTLS